MPNMSQKPLNPDDKHNKTDSQLHAEALFNNMGSSSMNNSNHSNGRKNTGWS